MRVARLAAGLGNIWLLWYIMTLYLAHQVDCSMRIFRATTFSLSFALGLSALTGSMCAAGAVDSDVKYPALVSAHARGIAPGKVTLPFIISLGQHPELLQPPYLRLLLGTPDKARLYQYPSNTFTWTPEDGTGARFTLSRSTDNRYPTGGEIRKFDASFKPAGIPLKTVRAHLGKPIRRYFDSRSFPVEIFQLAANTTLEVCEPTNSFDANLMTVCYNGPYLPQASSHEMAGAACFRLKQIDHHLAKGNPRRGLSLLQEHVSDNPEDIGAHIILAEALRQKCDINGSIFEYRRALALAQASGDVVQQNKVLKALAPLGLVPNSAPVVRALSLKDAASGGYLPQ